MQSRKRVVHLTTVHHPYDPRIYHKQCMSLQQANYDVTLIAQRAEDQTDASKPIKHIPLKNYGSRLKRMVFGAFDAYKKAKKLNAHIYVFHDPELLLVGALLKKKSNIVIYDIHEDYVTSILQKNYLKKPVRHLLAKGYKLIENIVTRKMELSLAEKYYKDIYKRGTCILNYPLMNEKFMNHKRKETSIEKKLLYTGNVTDDRGALIHASLPEIDPNVTVQFVGKCSSKLADKMYEVAGEHKKQVQIEGIDTFIEKDQMESMYLNHPWLAGLALFPPTEHYMKKELTKFFEYMNVGLPIICSDFPVWKEFIDLYQCGIAVNPYDETDIKTAIEMLHQNPDLVKEMGENGKKAVLEKLNWKVEERKLLRWYDELLEGKC